jgi:uncharacterized protein YndB with AHSA1/START domain
MRNHLVGGLLATAMSLCASARAEIIESSPASMKIRHVLEIAAPAPQVYQTFLRLGSWWSKEHTFSGNAANLTLRAVPGGCWCEKLPDGGGVQHMTVVYVAPGQRITLSGALGPLQTAGVAGAMSFSFVSKGSGTELVMTYSVGGYYPDGLASIAPGVDAVLREQLLRLKSVAETGSAAGATRKPRAAS